jgi:hypothetical protein
MIENVETYDCEMRNCGRKFETSNQLMDHYKRRHPEYSSKDDNSRDESESKMNKSKIIYDQLYKKIDEFEKDYTVIEDEISIYKNIVEDERDNQEDLQNEDEDHDHVETKTTDLENKKMMITSNSIFNLTNTEIIAEVTEEMIGFGTLYADYEEIEEV